MNNRREVHFQLISSFRTKSRLSQRISEAEHDYRRKIIIFADYERRKMVLLRLSNLVQLNRLSSSASCRNGAINLQLRRHKTHYRDGTLLPMPKSIPFGLIGIICSVVPGLFIGAAISKSVANFLEENDLFVPSEDDDDDN